MPLQVLLMLVKHAGETLTKQQLLDEIWQGKIVGEEVLTVAISQIRKALQGSAKTSGIIKTISGKGYRFIGTDFGFTSEEKQKAKQKSNPRNKTILLALTLILVVAAGVYWQFASSNGTVTALTEQERQKLQQGRYLLTRNNSSDRQSAMAILTPLLTMNPKNNDILIAWLQLHFQLAYAGERNWQILAEQLIPFIENSLVEQPDSELYLYLAELLFKGGWDFSAAERAFERSLEIDPQNGLASFAFAQFLLARGDFDRALTLTRRYIDLSPQAYSKPIVVWIYNMMQAYPMAIGELQSLQQYSEDTPEYWVSAQITWENVSEPHKAWPYFRNLLVHAGYLPDELAQVDKLFEAEGLPGVYGWLLNVKLEQTNLGQYHPPLAWARYAIKSGNIELALYYLEQAFAAKQYEVLWTGVDPTYQALYHSPKFSLLLKQHCIPFQPDHSL